MDEILGYFSDPLFPLFLFAVIVVVFTPIIWISSCKKITGTFNVPTLLLNRKYWAAVLYTSRQNSWSS